MMVNLDVGDYTKPANHRKTLWKTQRTTTLWKQK